MASVDWGKGIMLGMLVGIIWGWIAMAVNAITGAFPFENSLLYNLATFATGGAVFGIVASGFLGLLEGWLPLKGNVFKAIYIALSLWVILFIGGYLLATIKPERYTFEVHQGIQGFILVVVFGILLGLLWKIGRKEACP